MSRKTTAYVSKYQLDRVKELELFANAKVTLTANFAGLNLGHIQSATWYTTSPWSTVLSAPSIQDGKARVKVQAAISDMSILRCEVTFSNGEVYNQLWRVYVSDAPFFNNPVSQGPESVSVP